MCIGLRTTTRRSTAACRALLTTAIIWIVAAAVAGPASAAKPAPADSVAPQVRISSPYAGERFAPGPVSIEFGVTDPFPSSGIKSITCRLNTEKKASPCTNPKIYTVGPGNFTATVAATDQAGNTASATVNFVVPCCDTQAPVVEIVRPVDGGWSGSYLSPIVFTSDPDPSFGLVDVTCTLSRDGLPVETTDCYSSFETELTDGAAYSLTAVARDFGNNFGSSRVDFVVDATGPEVSISSPEEGARLLDGDLTASFTVGAAPAPLVSTTCEIWKRDAGMAIYEKIRSKSCAPPAVTFSALTPGNHAFVVHAADAAGNTGARFTEFTLVADNAAPVVDIYSPAEGESVSEANVGFTVQDADISSGIASITCELRAGNTLIDTDPACVSPKQFPGLADGNYSMTITAVDGRGNTTTVTRLFSVGAGGPPPTGETALLQRPPLTSSTSAESIGRVKNPAATAADWSSDGGSTWAACDFDAVTHVGTCPIVPAAGYGHVSYTMRARDGAVALPGTFSGHTWFDARTPAVMPAMTATANALAPVALQAGDHPDVTIDAAVEGASDVESLTLALPDGFALSPAAVPDASRCSLDSAAAGTCTEGARVGSVTFSYLTADDGLTSVTGDLFLTPASDRTRMAGVAVSAATPHGTIVIGGDLVATSQARSMRLELPSLPTAVGATDVHVTAVSIALDGEAGAQLTPPRPWVTNPHYCGSIWSSRPDLKNLVVGGTTSAGTLPERRVAYTVQTGCATTEAFAPLASAALSNPVSGEKTALSIGVDLGEETDPRNGDRPISPVTYAEIQLPPHVGENVASLGSSADMCSIAARRSDPVGGTAQPVHRYFDPTADRDTSTPQVEPACPAVAKVGRAILETPFAPAPVVGDVYFVIHAPVLDLGILFDPSTADGNPAGLSLGLYADGNLEDYNGSEWYTSAATGERTFGSCVPDVEIDQECQIAVTYRIQSLPDLPVTRLLLELGNVPGRSGVNGPLDSETHQIAGCLNPANPYTVPEYNGDTTGPPLVQRLAPLAKRTGASSSVVARTRLEVPLQPVSGC